MIQLLVQRSEEKSQVTLDFYLYNPSSFSFSLDGHLEGFETMQRLKGIYLLGDQLKKTFSLPVHLMRATPVLTYKVSMYSTKGFEDHCDGQVKVRAKDFANKLRAHEILEELCITYSLWNKSAKSTSSKMHSIGFQKKEKNQSYFNKVNIRDPEELMDFNPTIDLHIEKLVEDPSKVKSNTTFLLQLAAYKKHLDQALRLGVDRIFVIHGVGTGKLRKAVIDYAETLDLVREVKNEYHPKFGFGATEIIF